MDELKLTVNFKPIDIRLSTLPSVYGEKVVMRILDLSNALDRLDKIGFSRRKFKQLFSEMIQKPNGIVLNYRSNRIREIFDLICCIKSI